ncbi:hypothetical protein [Pararhizobium sp. DWP3-4]|uniref:hypothetical protein n=1 Tax=Pararhizobium sp. DWP3-4 TaxID=2804565 RepID=UPI003CED395B
MAQIARSSAQRDITLPHPPPPPHRPAYAGDDRNGKIPPIALPSRKSVSLRTRSTK